MAHVPFKGQALDVGKERVAHALDEVFGALGQRHAAHVVGKPADRRDRAQQHGGGQQRPAGSAFQQPGQEAQALRQGGVAQHAVHRDLDDLRGQRV